MSRRLLSRRFRHQDFRDRRRSTRASSLLRDDPRAKLVAGATDVGVESNLFGRRWPHLISLDAIDELREFSSTLRARHDRRRAAAARDWPRAGPTRPRRFENGSTLFASPLIRNRATIGGNLATASPIGDAAPMLLALDAIVHVAGLSGRRTIPLASFFTGYRKTAMGAGELIAAVEIPKPLPQFVRFYKVAKRRLDDISTVAAAMALDVDQHGKVRRARFAFGGVAATPLRVRRGRSRRRRSAVERRGGRARAGRSRPHVAADERSSRVEGISPRGVEVARREIPVGARAVKIDRHARSARERPRATSPARRCTSTISAGGIRISFTRGRCARLMRTRSSRDAGCVARARRARRDDRADAGRCARRGRQRRESS